MKRFIAILVSCTMIFALAATTFAAGADVTWEDYQQYLIDKAGSNAPDLQEFIDQVEAIGSWDELDQTVSPWDMMFSTIGLSTWEEFQDGIVKDAAVPAGENMGGGSSDDGESPEGESPEGESPEGESPAQAPEGESPEGESPEGESPAGEAPSGTKQSIEELTVSSFSTNNGDTSRPQDEGHIYVGYAITDGVLDADNSNWDGAVDNIVLDNVVEGEGFTAIRAEGDTKVNVTGTLILMDETDGQVVSDFTGVGAGITGYDGAVIEVNDMMYLSSGFARSFAIVQNGTLIVNNSDITALGNDPLLNAWDGYYNSANTSIMISPPWVLGIQGGIRAMNLLGAGSTLVVADSSVTAGGWGVLSTDGCTNPYLYLYNSTLAILPESEGGMNSGWAILGYDEDAYGTGYGTYLIGGAQEYFYGMDIHGETYASILTGGDGYYAGLKEGEVYEAVAEDGTVVGTYTAEEDVPTVIDTVFGFMAHNSGSINVLEGAVVNSAESTFLYKSADSVWTADGAELNPGNGIIFQMIDNDDSTVGGFNPFGTYLYEEAGFPEEAYADAIAYVFTTDTAVDPAKTYYIADIDAEGGYVAVEDPTDEGTVAYYERSTGGNQVTLNLANGEYTGDVYNATGYYAQASDALTVNIADSAVLNGDIALTSHIHGIFLNGRNVDDVIAAIDEANAYHANIGGYYEGIEDIEYVFINADGEVTEDKDAAVALQFTKFSTAEYYLMGHVLNKVNYNGLSSIDVYVEGEWNVKAASLVTYLAIADDASVYAEIIELPDGSILLIPSDEKLEAGEYGNAFIYVEAPGSAGGPGGGESAEGESEGESAEEGASEDGASPEGESPEEEAPAAPEGESPDGEAPADAPAEPADGPEALEELPAGDYVEASTVSEMAGDITVYIYYDVVDGQNVITDIIDKEGGFSIYSMVPDMAQFQTLLDEALAK